MSALFRAADGTFAPKDLEPAKVDLEPNATMEMNFDVLKVNCIVPVSALLLVQIGDNTLTADFTIKPARRERMRTRLPLSLLETSGDWRSAGECTRYGAGHRLLPRAGPEGHTKTAAPRHRTLPSPSHALTKSGMLLFRYFCRRTSISISFPVSKSRSFQKVQPLVCGYGLPGGDPITDFRAIPPAVDRES
jgi:hypothetical protein